jgi:hypothetical protein
MTNSHVEEPQQSAKGRLDVLLEEYRALRAEVNQRLATNGALVGFAAAGIAIFATGDHSRAVWWVAAAVGLLVVAVWGSNLLGLAALSKHLRGLELAINRYADLAFPRENAGASDLVPANLLSWETWRSHDGAGWMRRAGFGIQQMLGLGRRPAP